MAIVVSCGCGKRFKFEDEFAGRKTKCTGCGKVLTIPKPRASGPEPAPLGGLDPLVGPDLGPLAGLDPLGTSASPLSGATAGKSCPACLTPLAANAVICVACGFDLRSGSTLGAYTGRPATTSPQKKSSFSWPLIAGIGGGSVIAAVLIGGVIWLRNPPVAKPPGGDVAKAPETPQPDPAASPAAAPDDAPPDAATSVAASAPIARLMGHTAEIIDVAVSPNGQHLLSASRDNTIRLWDLATAKELRILKGGGNFDVMLGAGQSASGSSWANGVDFAPDGNTALFAWGASVTFSQNGERGPGVAKSAVQWWDLNAWKEIKRHDWEGASGSKAVFVPGGSLVRLSRSGAVNNSAEWLTLVDFGGNSALWYWDLKTGKPAQDYRKQQWQLTYSSDGRYALSPSLENTFVLIDVARGQELARFSGHTGGLLSMAFSPDSSQIISAGANTKEQVFRPAIADAHRQPDSAFDVQLWDTRTRNEVGRFKGVREPVHHLAFSPDGRHVLGRGLGQRGYVYVWNKATAELLSGFEAVTAGKFTPDGRSLLCSTTAGEYRLVELDSRKVKQTYATAADIRSVTFLADPQQFLSVDADFAMTIWKLPEPAAPVKLEPVSLAADPSQPPVVGGMPAAEELVEVRRLRKHQQPIISLALSADGTRLITGSWDRSVHVWDTQSGREVGALAGHQARVVSVALSTDGTKALTADSDKDGAIIVWNAAEGKEISRITGHRAAVKSAALSPDGTRALIACADKSVVLRDVQTSEVLLELAGHNQAVIQVGFSADGHRGFTLTKGNVPLGEENSLRVWDLESGKMVRQFDGHDREITIFAVSADSAQILLGTTTLADGNSRILLMDLESGKELHRLVGHKGGIKGLAFSADGRRAASASGDKSLRIWDLASGAQLAALTDLNWAPGLLALATDGSLLVAGSDDGQPAVPDVVVLGSPAAREAAQAVDAQRMAKAEQEGIAGELGRIEIPPVHHLVFAPDGKLLCACADKAVRIVDVAEQRVVKTLTGHTQPPVFVAVSRDGAWALSANSGFRPGAFVGKAPAGANVSLSAEAVAEMKISRLILWNLEKGEETKRMPMDSSGIVSLDFSRDGQKFCVACEDGTVRIWDVDEARELRRLSALPGVLGASFSSDGKTVYACAMDCTFVSWDANTGKERRREKVSPGSLKCIAFSDDGKRALVGSLEGVVGQVALDTLKPQKALQLPDAKSASQVLCLAYSPDGRRALSGSFDHTVALWDLAKAKEIERFRVDGFARSVAFSANGRQAAVALAGQTQRGGLILLSLPR